ncbi:hypothetical protein [Actinoplanes subtropicus]|uniref:hypothetical protein n=1 Tax=Actinoplanes subtropicus TaxID=543632 RepID=UPI0012FB4427|nr:hypothetical protein [Actinoplanes subtropicus]
MTGLALGAGTGFADSVPPILNEVGKARADRSGWSQASEFVSLILDSGWAWAATAVLAGWLVSRARQPPPTGTPASASAAVAVAGNPPRPFLGALAGFVALSMATVAFYGVQGLFADGWDGWSYQVRFWLVRALVLGMPLGALGVLARRGGITGALAALVVPLGAVLNLIVLPLPGDSRMAGPVAVTIWTGAVLGVVLILLRLVRERMRPVLPPDAASSQATRKAGMLPKFRGPGAVRP